MLFNVKLELYYSLEFYSKTNLPINIKVISTKNSVIVENLNDSNIYDCVYTCGDFMHLINVNRVYFMDNKMYRIYDKNKTLILLNNDEFSYFYFPSKSFKIKKLV